MADKYFVHKQCCLIVAVVIMLSVSNPETQENCVTQESFSACESGRGWCDQERLQSVYQRQ